MLWLFYPSPITGLSPFYAIIRTICLPNLEISQPLLPLQCWRYTGWSKTIPACLNFLLSTIYQHKAAGAQPINLDGSCVTEHSRNFLAWACMWILLNTPLDWPHSVKATISRSALSCKMHLLIYQAGASLSPSPLQPTRHAHRPTGSHIPRASSTAASCKHTTKHSGECKKWCYSHIK